MLSESWKNELWYCVWAPRCLDRSQFFPPEHPMACKKEDLICCDDSDFCNSLYAPISREAGARSGGTTTNLQPPEPLDPIGPLASTLPPGSLPEQKAKVTESLFITIAFLIIDTHIFLIIIFFWGVTLKKKSSPTAR